MKLILVLAGILSSHAMASSTDFSEQMANTPCTKQLRAQLTPSLERQTWYPQVVSVPGRPLVYGIAFRDTRSSTAYEVWSDNGSAILLRSDLKTLKETKYVWTSASACQLVKTKGEVQLPTIPQNGGFTDNNLRDLLSAHTWGVIYVWTPYMPLSVDALKEIKTAVQAKGGFLTILLDGKANLQQAQAWVTKGLVQTSELTPVNSYELYARELALHYPIAFIYKNRFLSDRSFVGHKTADMYQKWIDIELANIDKDLK